MQIAAVSWQEKARTYQYRLGQVIALQVSSSVAVQTSKERMT